MLYLIRNKSDRKLLGLFYASSMSSLWDTIDEGTSPYEIEFCDLEVDSGGMWFEDVTEEPDCEDDLYRYPLVNHVTFNEEVDVGLFDAYQEYINKKDSDELEWRQFDRKGAVGTNEYTRDMLVAACEEIEEVKSR